jgi:hypothetical protein
MCDYPMEKPAGGATRAIILTSIFHADCFDIKKKPHRESTDLRAC